MESIKEDSNNVFQKKLETDERLKKVKDIFANLKRGKVLDLGCSEGDCAYMLKNMGFNVVAGDINKDVFKYGEEVKFEFCDLKSTLLFENNYFDYICFFEVIEHLRHPFQVMHEISRILKPGGFLFLSTPNILNIHSRVRFLFEGSFDFFREPILDYVKLGKFNIENMHLIPWRYHELEYLLHDSDLTVQNVYTDHAKYKFSFLSLFLMPLLKFQYRQKEKRALKKGDVDYRRINKILLSDELIFGRHLIIKSKKA